MPLREDVVVGHGADDLDLCEIAALRNDEKLS